MRKGFVLQIIVLLFAAVGIYLLYTKYARGVNSQTQKTAESIIKHPNASKWQIKNRKNFCFLATDQCIQPSMIDFSAPDQWYDIYAFYKPAMTGAGWSTQNTIVTSTPTSIVFTNSNECQAVLAPKSKISLGGKKPTAGSFEYTFRITCPEESSI